MVLIKIFIGIIIAIKVYDIATRKYVNPYKMILYFGKKGAGKTTLLTKIAINNIKKGRIVYSTEEIPGTRLFNPLNVELYTMEPNSIVLIDEISKFFDNRDFKNFKKEYTTFFRYSRQYKLEIHAFSQSYNDCDLKIRTLIDRYYIVENVGRIFTVAKLITKNINVGHDMEGQGRIIDDYQIVPFFMPKSRIVTFIPRWKEFYNSYNPPKREYMPHKQLTLNDIQVMSMNNHNKLIIKKLLNEMRSKTIRSLTKCSNWFRLLFMKKL